MILDIVISGLPGHIQTKRKGDFSFVLTISSEKYLTANSTGVTAILDVFLEIQKRRLKWVDLVRKFAFLLVVF